MTWSGPFNYIVMGSLDAGYSGRWWDGNQMFLGPNHYKEAAWKYHFDLT
jgi:hypothetical protein